ncbi:hypothetical protein BD413DRAFT_298452 [Trametes elegans]|nr:hypothetical protein BD413DRAFT_298452 [Trametes elegans]
MKTKHLGVKKRGDNSIAWQVPPRHSPVTGTFRRRRRGALQAQFATRSPHSGTHGPGCTAHVHDAHMHASVGSCLTVCGQRGDGRPPLLRNECRCGRLAFSGRLIRQGQQTTTLCLTSAVATLTSQS